MTRSSLCGVALLLLVSGCGNRGVLYLPSTVDDEQLEEDARLIEQAAPVGATPPLGNTIDAELTDDEEERARQRRDGSVTVQPSDDSTPPESAVE